MEVDVIARDKHGKPVSGLGAKDFTLFDDGEEQKIARVSVERETPETVSAAPAADRKTQPNQETFNNTHQENVVPTVILFDVLNTPPENQVSMKNALLHALNHMQEGTPVALLILGDDLTVVSDFTTSSISLTQAAGEQFGLRPEGFGPPITARATGNSVRDHMIMKAATHAILAEDHDRVVRTLEALNLICRQLAGLRGRKSLMWITGGLSVSGESQSVQDAIDRLNDANVAVYTVDARGVLLDPGISAENDPNDLTAPVQQEREEVRGDVLAVVAASTGGAFYHNTNSLDDAVGRALQDRSLVYVLDYYPGHGDWNGKLHKLKVTTSRPGVSLRYRASYRATTPSQPTVLEQQQMLAAVASASLDFPGIRFSVDIKPGPASDPHFVLHVPVEEMQWSAEDGNMIAVLQVWFIQKRASGADLATSNWRSNLRLASAPYQAAVRSGVAFGADLKLQEGAARIRVLVRDANSGRIGSVDVPVDSNPASKISH